MRNLSRAIVLFTAVAMVLPSGPIASAHTVAYPTSLTLKASPSGPVARGTAVTFKGRLSSSKRACVRRVKVKLLQVGVGFVAHKRTGRGGGYSFVQKLRETGDWRVRFLGRVLNAQHPHNHTCDASTSHVVTVEVG